MSKRGHYRDSALSSRERSVSSPGLHWIVMAVVVMLPWTEPRWALPFLCVLATTPEVSEKLGKRHKTVGMRAHQMVSLLRRWLPTRAHQAHRRHRLQHPGTGTALCRSTA